jgi:hypothetical protein
MSQTGPCVSDTTVVTTYLFDMVKLLGKQGSGEARPGSYAQFD